MRPTCIVLVLVLVPACGSRRIAGYLEDLENCSTSSSGTGGTGTTQSPGSSEDTSSSDSTAETTGDDSESADTSTSTGDTSTTDTSTTDASGTSVGTTDDPMAECGNGILEAFGPEPEECDDGNLDPSDGCNNCALDRRVFVTSELFKGGDLESLYLADALCANFADDQGWPDGLKYRAWLSDSATDARDRFTRGRGRLVMANGLVFANSWSALLDGQLENALEVTEKSETYHGGVWTGTRPDGTKVPAAEHCEEWATDMALKTGHYGRSDAKTPEWTLAESNVQPSPCIADYALYCFQSL